MKELWDVLSKIYKIIKNVKPQEEESNFDIDSKVSFAIKGYKRIILDNTIIKSDNLNSLPYGFLND